MRRTSTPPPPALRAAVTHRQRLSCRSVRPAPRAHGAASRRALSDLNDTPESAPLDPLLNGSDLEDVSHHPAYIRDGRTGTFKTSKDKFDCLLLSPELFGAVTQAGLNRSGVWHGPKVKNPWPMLQTLTKEEQAASDRAAIWDDITP